MIPCSWHHRGHRSPGLEAAAVGRSRGPESSLCKACSTAEAVGKSPLPLELNYSPIRTGRSEASRGGSTGGGSV